MGTDILAKFMDGRLLVRESRLCETKYEVSTGVPIRVGLVRQVNYVLSVDTDYAQYGVTANLADVTISGAQLGVRLRRGDMQNLFDATVGGTLLSGTASGLLMSVSGMCSGLTSGLGWRGELLSGNMNVSGYVTILANVIGW